MRRVEEWEALAEQAIHEQNRDRLLEIIAALARALQNRDLERNQTKHSGAA